MSTRIDDTDSRFDYKDSLWQSSGESGDFMATAHSTSTPGAQVVFGPFQGERILFFFCIALRPKITNEYALFQKDPQSRSLEELAQISLPCTTSSTQVRRASMQNIHQRGVHRCFNNNYTRLQTLTRQEIIHCKLINSIAELLLWTTLS